MATRVNHKHRQGFRLHDPTAKTVLLVGDFTNWERHPKSMQKGVDGFWTTSIELAPGKHLYRFIVDGEWRDDPECLTDAANPFGGQDMVLDAN